MEKELSSVVVVADEQSRRLGFLNDQPAQRLNFGRLAPTRRIELC
jgi:hypothetical protein